MSKVEDENKQNSLLDSKELLACLLSRELETKGGLMEGASSEICVSH